jgi:hypothetical protein
MLPSGCQRAVEVSSRGLAANELCAFRELRMSEVGDERAVPRVRFQNRLRPGVRAANTSPAPNDELG